MFSSRQQGSHLRHLICGLSALLASACSTPGAPPQTIEKNAALVRFQAGEPNWGASDQAQFGIGLSGGGSKASAYAFGVLAGLDDLAFIPGFTPPGNGDWPRDKPRASLIGSVSGGGYSAYYFYTQALSDAQRQRPPLEQKSPYAHLFQDRITCKSADKPGSHTCGDGSRSQDVTHDTPFGPALFSLLQENQQLHLYSDTQRGYPDDHTYARDSRRLFALRCGQDVLQPGHCSSLATSQDKVLNLSSGVGLLFGTLISAVPHHLFNTLFDAGINASPPRLIYERGIGLTYGAVIPNEPAQSAYPPELGKECPDLPWATARLHCLATDTPQPFSALVTQLPAGSKQAAAKGHILNCYRPIKEAGSIPQQQCASALADFAAYPTPLEFDTLRQRVFSAHDRTGLFPLPYWVMQATSTRSRSVFSWFTDPRSEMTRDVFEMTPLLHGSDRYGYRTGHVTDFNALDSVVASAAFFDANQQTISDPVLRPLFALTQHLLNLNWGVDIPNYNVSDTRRAWHSILPFPLYFVDSFHLRMTAPPEDKDRFRSPFIRLTDGGNAENTGALAAIRRGIPTIVISDAAQDSDYSFGDLCRLKLGLEGLAPDEIQQYITLPRGTGPQPPGARLALHIPGLDQFDSHCITHPTFIDFVANGFAQGKSLTSYYEVQDSGSPTLLSSLLGCVEFAHDGPPCQKSLYRLIVLKPLLSTQQLKQSWNRGPSPYVRQMQACTHAGKLYTTSPRPTARDCTTPEISADILEECKRAVPCEVARFSHQLDVGEIGKDFPQTATVSTTFNSSATLFAAYRELARWQTINSAPAIRAATANDGRFLRLIAEQGQTPFKRNTKIK